jgi:CheY-like chemotaxis protein
MDVMREPDDLNSLRVLIAGGRPHSVQLLRQIFDMLGIRRVHAEAQLDAAIDLLRTHQFSAVFCDEQIGDSDAFVASARRAPDLVDPMVPIFLVCGSPKRRDVEAARDLGFTDVLTRPVSAATISRKLTTATIHPRPFIASNEFFGPDRRTAARGWTGGERRTRTPRKIKVPKRSDLRPNDD